MLSMAGTHRSLLIAASLGKNLSIRGYVHKGRERSGGLDPPTPPSVELGHLWPPLALLKHSRLATLEG